MFTKLTRPERDDVASGVNESYLEAGRRGKNTWPRYLLGVVFILFMWFVVGGWASLALGNAPLLPGGLRALHEASRPVYAQSVLIADGSGIISSALPLPLFIQAPGR
jgi:hypothetical protein